MATHSTILAWRIPWTEEPGRLQSTGSQIVRHDWGTNTHTHDCIYRLIASVLFSGLSLFILTLKLSQVWSIEAPSRLFPEKAMAFPTPVLLPGKSHGWRSLVGCSPWDRKESDTTERLRFHFSLSCIGEGNGNPLQCSCLENPRDRGAIYGVTQSQTRLERLSSSSSKIISVLFQHVIIILREFPSTVVQDVPGQSCSFPAPTLESAICPRKPRFL